MPAIGGLVASRSTYHTTTERNLVVMRWLRFLVVVAVVAVLSWPTSPSKASGAGQFIVQCHGPVLSAAFDPIVHPGNPAPPGQHNHEFFANRTINSDSTYLSLRRGATSCDAAGDTASYWVPTLYDNGQRVPATRLTAYYNSDTTKVEPWPAGLKMIAGNAHASSPQSTKIVYWGCGNGSGTSKVDSPPQCGSSGKLTLHVIFPDCWNGSQTDSPDHQSHMSYSNGGTCDAQHPHHLTQLTDRFEWADYRPDPKRLTLSSGSVNTMHADFWQTWDQSRLDSVTAYCINGGRQCSADEAIAHQGPAQPK